MPATESGHWWLNQSDPLILMTCKTLTQQYKPDGTSSRSTQEISLLDFIRSTSNSNTPPESTCTELQLVSTPVQGGLGTLLSTGPPHQLTNIHHLPSRSPAASPAVSHTPHHYQKHYIVSDTVYSFQVVSCVK